MGKREDRSRADPAAVAPRTLHARILAELRQRILGGDWPPGYRLPIETELMAHYRCARMTVSKVVGELVRAGLVERRRRAGSFVRSPRSQSAVLRIQDVRSEVEALGLAYRYHVTSRARRRGRLEDRKLLKLPAGAPILAVEGLHFAGSNPFCREQRLINLAAVPSARAETFAEQAPGPWLVEHIPWSEAEHRIRAVGADAGMARSLRVRRGTPCLVVERTTWRGAVPVTHVKLTYRADSHELVARFTPAIT